MRQEIINEIDKAKRACSRCNSHKTFNPNEEDRKIAQDSCKRAHKVLNEVFDEMRRQDQTTIDQINSLKGAKRLCLDAYDKCKTCDKEFPLVRQMLINIK